MKLKTNPISLNFKEDNNVVQVAFEIRYENRSSAVLYAELFSKIKNLDENVTVDIIKFNNQLMNNELDDAFTLKVSTKELSYSVQITSTNLVITITNKYKGWNNYFKFVNEILTDASILPITRFGLRYTTAFEINEATNNSHLEIKICDDSLLNSEESSTHLTHQFKVHDFNCIMNIADRAHIFSLSKQSFSVNSLIDIDIVKEPVENVDLNELLGQITAAHNLEKLVISSILKDEFIQRLNNDISN